MFGMGPTGTTRVALIYEKERMVRNINELLKNIIPAGVTNNNVS
jgi:hypothetical protein